jgi:hypothetical protein
VKKKMYTCLQNGYLEKIIPELIAWVDLSIVMTGEYSHGYLPFWIVKEASTHMIVFHSKWGKHTYDRFS